MLSLDFLLNGLNGRSKTAATANISVDRFPKPNNMNGVPPTSAVLHLLTYPGPRFSRLETLKSK